MDGGEELEESNSKGGFTLISSPLIVLAVENDDRLM